MSKLEETGSSLSCCKWFAAEWRAPIFGLEDTRDPTKTVDLVKTFVPQSIWASIFKIASFAYSISVMATSISRSREPDFWLIFLTNWTMVFTVLYLLLSSIFVFYRNPSPTSPLLYFAWGVYIIASCAQVLITLLYWTLEFPSVDSPPTYVTIAGHGLLIIPMLGDGVVFNRIPVRLRQLALFEAYCIIFLIWTVIHGALNIGTSRDNNESLYAVVDWRDAPGLAGIVAAGSVFAIIPAVFFFIWFLSLIGEGCCTFDGSRRRYVNPTLVEGQQEETPQENATGKMVPVSVA